MALQIVHIVNLRLKCKFLKKTLVAGRPLYHFEEEKKEVYSKHSFGSFRPISQNFP